MHVCLQAGNYIKGDVVTIVIQLVSETTSLHAYSVQQLFRALRTHYTEQPLAQVAAWCIGEYGELINSQNVEDEEPLQVYTVFSTPCSTLFKLSYLRILNF